MNKIVVKSELGPLTFICAMHQANSAEDLRLSVEEFYKKWRKNHDLPSFPHYEVELLNQDEIEQKFPKPDLHVHKSEDGKKFMCYTPDIPSPEAAYLMWKAWCVGSVYSLIRYKTTQDPKEYDFGYPFAACKEDHQVFIDLMAKEQGITIAE
jgi:hypothetical protein